MRDEVELTAARYAAEARGVEGDLAAAATVVVSLVLALAAGSWAAVLGLQHVVADWAAPLLVCGGWLALAGTAVAFERPRRLARRRRREHRATDELLRERREAEEAVRVTAELLAAAVARDAAERELARDAELVERGAESIVRAAMSLAEAPVRACGSVLDRLLGASAV